MKNKLSKIAILTFCLLVTAGLFSCRKSGQPSWNVQLLGPVLNANLSINDIITSKYLTTNADNTVSLVYTDSLYNLNLDTLLNIPDTIFVYDTASPLTITIQPGQPMFYTLPKAVPYSLGGVELVEGTLQSGYMVYTLTNPLSQPIDYFYKVYNITRNTTDTLEIKKMVPANTTIKDSINMAGYYVDFSGPTHNGYNEITSNIEVFLDNSASPLTIYAGDKVVDANITFKKVLPYYARGYFGTITKSFGPSSVSFPVFNKIIAGNLNLQSVSVNLTLVNGFGVDARLILSQLSAINSRTNQTVNLSAQGIINSTINVTRATESNNPSDPVNPTSMNFSITPANSNILTWLDNLPTSVSYAVQITTDPNGNISGFHDFAYYGYGINSAINVTIPLSLIATNLTLADTLGINFSSNNTAQQVQNGTLTIFASNGFPFSAALQMYLLNSNNVVADSLFIPAQTIATARVNAITGIVTSPQNSVLTISLDASHTQELINTKTVILYARFNMGSLPSTYLKIYDYYKLGIKMTANFNYKVN